MSLLTMGYGHRTIITMGLGTFIIKGVFNYIRPAWGEVSFEKVNTQVDIEQVDTDVVDIEQVEVEVKIRETTPEVEVDNG